MIIFGKILKKHLPFVLEELKARKIVLDDNLKKSRIQNLIKLIKENEWLNIENKTRLTDKEKYIILFVMKITKIA